MKPFKIITLNLILLLSISAKSQVIDPEDIENPYNTLSYGVKMGLSYATATKGTANVAPDSRLGFVVGIFGEVPIVNDLLSVQGEVLYSVQGFERLYKISGEEKNAKYNLDYINVPIFAKYYLVKGFSIEAGPQFGLLVNHRISTPFSREENPIPEKVEDFDLSIAVGTSFKFNSGLFVNIRYTHGFTDVIEEIEAKNTTFQLGLGYKF
mgnify:CR=1 FL=1